MDKGKAKMKLSSLWCLDISSKGSVFHNKSQLMGTKIGQEEAT